MNAVRGSALFGIADAGSNAPVTLRVWSTTLLRLGTEWRCSHRCSRRCNGKGTEAPLSPARAARVAV
jgi:hypothetical protein